MGFSSRTCCTMLLALSVVFLIDARGLDDVPTVIGRGLLIATDESECGFLHPR